MAASEDALPEDRTSSAGAVDMPLGAQVVDGGVRFSVWSSAATRMWVSLFGEWSDELDRVELSRTEDGVFSAVVPGIGEGAHYGFRADGRYDPDRGDWFDPWKLLTDPYAVEVNWPYRYSAVLAAPRWQQCDTGPLMPKSVVKTFGQVTRKTPVFRPGGLIYELNVRAFTKLHPDVPEEQRGTIAALRHPAIIEHLKKIGVSAVELMPVTAWIDERHLPPLGLRNAWGYNPVSFMALDPRLAPGGIEELADTVAALREAGIGVILDLVFNHTGESDAQGPTLSLRGLDNRAYYRNVPGKPGTLVNDTGTGNTLACDHPMVSRLILDSLRHFVAHAGVDGFRFDLAPVLGRVGHDFRRDAPLFQAMAADPLLADRVMIAEPWDIGHGGYQLGNFPENWLEWNDRYRDDVRRFWRGDHQTVGALATRLAGSSDAFGAGLSTRTRSVNFVAAHDGMTLADITAYERKHNEANGEQNRDGHNENFSWNNGIEGDTGEQRIVDQRRADRRALLATLFASRGTIMLTAGDEFGRTQHGNNNAYAQDNEIGWIDWGARDNELEDYAAALSALRRGSQAFMDDRLLTGEGDPPDVAWVTETGQPMREVDWQNPNRRRLGMVLAQPDGSRQAVAINGDRRAVVWTLPPRDGYRWVQQLPERNDRAGMLDADRFWVDGTSVLFAREQAAGAHRDAGDGE